VEINPYAWTPIVSGATYTVVANAYIASGGDGYSTFETLSSEGKAENTCEIDAQALIEYAKHTKTMEDLPLSVYSTQQFTPFKKNGDCDPAC
jgi:5'-nucleotidase/UDP-sugar diphosphatase